MINSEWKTIAWTYILIGLLYVTYNPVLLLFGDVNEIGALVNGDGTMTPYGAYTVFLVITFLGAAAYLIIGKDRFITRNQDDRIRREINNTSVLVLLFLASANIVWVWYSGQADFQGLFNRANRNEIALLGSQQWVVSLIVTQAILYTCVYWWHSLTRYSKLASVSVGAGMLLTDFALAGGRRNILPVILFALYSTGFLSKLTKSVRNSIIAVILAIGFFLFGGVREFIFNKETQYITLSSVASLTKESNEFQEIGHGIYNATQYVSSEGNEHGQTYITAWYIFVPRAWWPEKPVSLTYRMGAMVSPFAEAYLNFGMAGAFIIAIGLTIMIFIVQRGRGSFWACCIIAYCFDQMRTGFAEAIYTAFVIGIVFLVVTRRRNVNVKNADSNLRTFEDEKKALPGRCFYRILAGPVLLRELLLAEGSSCAYSGLLRGSAEYNRGISYSLNRHS